MNTKLPAEYQVVLVAIFAVSFMESFLRESAGWALIALVSGMFLFICIKLNLF
jgi:hypothetical protein